MQRHFLLFTSASSCERTPSSSKSHARGQLEIPTSSQNLPTHDLTITILVRLADHLVDFLVGELLAQVGCQNQTKGQRSVMPLTGS